jgi:hypothetical protein
MEQTPDNSHNLGPQLSITPNSSDACTEFSGPVGTYWELWGPIGTETTFFRQAPPKITVYCANYAKTLPNRLLLLFAIFVPFCSSSSRLPHRK